MNTLSPKQRFQKSPHFHEHEVLVEKESFIEAIQSALNEMVVRQPETGNPSQAWDSHCKIVGARNFISILLNLAEKDAPIKKDTSGSLRYPATTE